MKLLVGDGRTLRIYEVSASPVYEVRAKGPYHPVKFNGSRIVDEAEARAIVADFREAGYPCRRLGDAGGGAGVASSPALHCPPDAGSSRSDGE